MTLLVYSRPLTKETSAESILSSCKKNWIPQSLYSIVYIDTTIFKNDFKGPYVSGLHLYVLFFVIHVNYCKIFSLSTPLESSYKRTLFLTKCKDNRLSGLITIMQMSFNFFRYSSIILQSVIFLLCVRRVKIHLYRLALCTLYDIQHNDTLPCVYSNSEVISITDVNIFFYKNVR